MTEPLSSVENVDDKSKRTGQKKFGWRLFNRPCFSEALKTSTFSGMGLGLASFWFTSDVPKSLRRTFITILIIHPVSWFYCRYNHRKEYFKIQEDRLKNPSAKPSFLLPKEDGDR